MAKPQKGILTALQTIYKISRSPAPHHAPISSLHPRLLIPRHSSSLASPRFPPCPASPNAALFSPKANPLTDLLARPSLTIPRRLSSLPKFKGEAARSVVQRPLSAASAALARYREAAGLQLEAFWSRNYLVLVGAGAVAVCIALWKIMFGVASTFVGLSEGMAKYGFLALATAMVSFAGMYLRSRFTINPDKIYRIAMRKLNTSAGILEVMGAPLTGSEARAYVMSGGGPKLKNFKFRLGGKRCFLIFPIRGSERRGLVSVEVKKKKGQYDMKLLAVDIPMASGPDQRIFLIGDEEEYKVGGGLISELRDPIVKALAAEKEFEDLDQMEEEEDEIREQEEAARKRQEEEEKMLEEEKRKRHELESLGR